MSPRPEFLMSGSLARLFPVLTSGSKEGRTTSVVLACMGMIHEFSAEMLGSIEVKFGKRATLSTFTEVVFKGEASKHDRPDGLLIVRAGSLEWKALVETKIGKSELCVDQIERYRKLAREHGIDCVITISNQFATSPTLHPLTPQLSKQVRIPVYHWSWMFILTMADLLYSNQEIADESQRMLLNELRRFLSHESVGVEGFDKMPREWPDLVRLAGTGAPIGKNSPGTSVVADAWMQETRDISLMLTRKLDVVVKEKLARRLTTDFEERRQSVINTLSSRNEMLATFDVPNAAGGLDVIANLKARTIHVGMKLRAPQDKVSSKARLNWLLRQLKEDVNQDYFVRLHWPGKSAPTQCLLSDLRDGNKDWERDRKKGEVHTFEVFKLVNTGSRFGQLGNFISDLEASVIDFYHRIGQNLSPWKERAPKTKEAATSVEGISEDAENAGQFSDTTPSNGVPEMEDDARPSPNGDVNQSR